jgi:hypothetical protein
VREIENLPRSRAQTIGGELQRLTWASMGAAISQKNLFDVIVCGRVIFYQMRPPAGQRIDQC